MSLLPGGPAGLRGGIGEEPVQVGSWEQCLEQQQNLMETRLVSSEASFRGASLLPQLGSRPAADLSRRLWGVIWVFGLMSLALMAAMF